MLLHIHLRMNLYAKLLLHILLDGLTEFNDFLTRSAATIHKHQRLLVMHTGSTQILSLPATLVDQPASAIPTHSMPYRHWRKPISAA